MKKQVNDGRGCEDRATRIDPWIKQHVLESPERTHDGSPMAAISVSVRYEWAKKAEVELDVVNERVDALCNVVSPDQEPELDEHCVADRFRLRREVSNDKSNPRARS